MICNQCEERSPWRSVHRRSVPRTGRVRSGQSKILLKTARKLVLHVLYTRMTCSSRLSILLFSAASGSGSSGLIIESDWPFWCDIVPVVRTPYYGYGRARWVTTPCQPKVQVYVLVRLTTSSSDRYCCIALEYLLLFPHQQIKYWLLSRKDFLGFTSSANCL